MQDSGIVETSILAIEEVRQETGSRIGYLEQVIQDLNEAAAKLQSTLDEFSL